MLVYYTIMGLEDDASDAQIRSRYLELVKRYTPEKEPDAFKLITVAYDAIKDKRSRIQTRLFGTSENAQCEELIRAMTLSRETKRRLPSLTEIVEYETDMKKGIKQK